MSNWLFFNYNNWKVLLPMASIILLTGLKFGITILDFIVVVGIIFHYVYSFGLPKKTTKGKRGNDEPIKIRR
ncbi:hypothetical protein BCT94_05700 [Vibrio breoganii]|uniref:Uncharacterized protein n=1 Tax=Vibrio breoganii TaxID=553239 RepID=A0AAP8MYR3_9VIBR|nr:hypothetical protein [Vibrio breoganii]PMK31611.1 hypothetical protein BCU03_07030 [Vibrio breoganii]PMK78579.1 hypothetical protein BCT94_05700 [Vibrio breoganii]PMP14079.1 hypothetical protein BCS93_04630 [Vibrio breoganii]